jgi:glutamate carboxypeptidase
MSGFAPHLAWIDSQRERMVRLVTEWANINSSSDHPAGLERCAGAILPELERFDARVTNEQGVIVASKRPDAAVRVLLGIHYDTVYGPDDPFQRVTRADENRLNGPGVADAKGGIVVMLAALEALERSPYAGRIGWELFLNPDEELGSPGSSPLIARLATGKVAGLLFEPCLPDGAMVSERKGSGNFAAIMSGRSAHAGRDPQNGRNAIHALAEFVVSVSGWTDLDRGVSVNVGEIEGGGPVNVVPDRASCRFNVRVRTPEQQREIERRLRDWVASFSRREGYRLTLEGGFTAPPKPLDAPTLRLLETVRDCGRELSLPIDWRPSGGVCDGNRLAAAGLPTVDTLGPCGGELHSPREYLLIDSLTERAKLAALLLLTLAVGAA